MLVLPGSVWRTGIGMSRAGTARTRDGGFWEGEGLREERKARKRPAHAGFIIADIN